MSKLQEESEFVLVRLIFISIAGLHHLQQIIRVILCIKRKRLHPTFHLSVFNGENARLLVDNS